MSDQARVINQTLLAEIYSNASLPSWGARCLEKLNDTKFANASFVDAYGKNPSNVSNLTDLTWGITIGTCNKFCNSSELPYSFNFQAFAAAMTNYFLPWLTLTAQLPFETGDPWSNVMSFCLALGSPSLITFSLTITILNRLWVRQKFARLRSKAPGRRFERFHDYENRVRSVQYLLQEAQQVPLRASQEHGWLSSLIVIPDNGNWWKLLEGRLRSTRRGFTASLVAQMALAFVAYLFTVIASFLAYLGDPNTALQIASGSIWIWLIPVILGWITVGTQTTDHSIEDALAVENAVRANETPIVNNDVYAEPAEQRGLIVRGGLNLQPNRVQTAAGVFQAYDSARLEIPGWLGATVGGDEEIKGPIHNYARVFTWWQLATTIHKSLHRTLENIHEQKPCISTNQKGTSPPPTWVDADGVENLLGDSLGTADYCGMGTMPVKAYESWSNMESSVYRSIFAASLAAIFVQWGTTGASILIAYTTPTVGLGCRSGSYVFYGGVGTAAWLCLFAAMLLSHEVMLRYQEKHIENTAIDFRKRPSNSSNNPDNRYERTLMHSFLCGAAVSLRYTGKLLCIVNTIWLILSSLAEFTGGFDNCWCMGNAFGMGKDGWVVLFKDAADLAATATLPWSGGLVLTLGVCCLSYAFFALGSVNNGE